MAAFGTAPMPPVFQNSSGPKGPVYPEIGKPSQMQYLRNVLVSGWFTKAEMRVKLQREYPDTKGSIVQMTLYKLYKAKKLSRRKRDHIGDWEYHVPVEMTQEVCVDSSSD